MSGSGTISNPGLLVSDPVITGFGTGDLELKINDAEQFKSYSTGEFNRKYFHYSLFAMPFIIPLAIWSSWDFVNRFDQVWLKIAICVRISIGAYIGGVLLFWWNGFWQNRRRQSSV
ncbi:hypothetical protein [Arcanobacterium urinimassiliense]|uniref:hypothetical protein n=1 Tax=Arcanobacterium urinimassiliense TaxID=1871014 RepID=UPI00093EA009|nr:hypothetical protein [Arcanobacterium urinimassiliense]